MVSSSITNGMESFADTEFRVSAINILKVCNYVHTSPSMKYCWDYQIQRLVVKSSAKGVCTCLHVLWVLRFDTRQSPIIPHLLCPQTSSLVAVVVFPRSIHDIILQLFIFDVSIIGPLLCSLHHEFADLEIVIETLRFIQLFLVSSLSF